MSNSVVVLGKTEQLGKVLYKLRAEYWYPEKKYVVLLLLENSNAFNWSKLNVYIKTTAHKLIDKANASGYILPDQKDDLKILMRI